MSVTSRNLAVDGAAPRDAAEPYTPSGGAAMTLPLRGFIALVAAHCLVDCFGGFWAILKHKDLANLDLAWAGAIGAVANFAGSAVQPFFGYLADRGRTRRMILWGAALVCLGMFTGPVGANMDPQRAAGYWVLAGLLLAVRVGQGMFHPPAAALAGSCSDLRRSTLVAAFIACGMIGFSISQALYSAVFIQTGGHTTWLLVPGALVLLAVAAWCRVDESTVGSGPTLRQLVVGLHGIRSPLVALFGIQVLGSALNLGLIFLLPELIEHRGYPRWLVHGGAFGLVIAGSVIVMVPAGHLADRFGRRRTMAVILVGAAATYYALISLGRMPVGMFVALCLVTGGFIGTANPLGVAFGQHLAPGRQSFVSGILMGLSWALGSVAMVVVGVLASRPGIGPVGALAWLGITAIVAPFLILLLPRTGLRE